MKDYIVPKLGYVLRDANGQQCYLCAIVFRKSYFGHVDYCFVILGIYYSTCTFNLYYIYVNENVLWNKACESVTSNKLMYILSINLLNIFCING